MVKVLINEPSFLVRKGLISILKELKGDMKIRELSHTDDIKMVFNRLSPHVLIINSDSSIDINSLIKNYSEEVRVMYISNSKLSIKNSSTHIYLSDTKSTLINKLGDIIKTVKNTVEDTDIYTELSDREKDVLREVALGKTNKEIASNLFISTHTVISHRKNITHKLGIKTVAGLTVYAILNNIIAVKDVS